MKKRFLILLLLGCLLVCSGYTMGNQIPEDAYGNGTEDAYWTSQGTEGFSFETNGTEGSQGIRLALSEAGYGSASCTVPVAPGAIYRISYYVKIVGQGKVYCIPQQLESSRSPVSVSQEGEFVEFYGLTAPDQSTLTLSFHLGDEAATAQGSASITQIRVEESDSVPEGALYVWLYDNVAWEAQNTATATLETEDTASKNGGVLGVVLVVLAFLLAAALMIRFRVFDSPLLRPASGRRVWIPIGIGVAISLILGAVTFGHPTDMVNFSSWALHAGKVGLPNFYISGMWADYPPGYIYVLYVIGLIGNLFQLQVGSVGLNLLIKLPSILCDAACGYFIYRLARKSLGERNAVRLCAFYMLNPLILFNSAVWGQMDGVLALLTVLMLYAYLQEKKPLCAVFFVLGVLVKPQMLMFGPIMLVAFLRDVVHRPKQELLATLYSILAGAATLVLVALPFTLKQNPLWLWEKYAGAAGLYPYATVNAFNLYALVGANWAPDTGIFFLGLSYRTLGIACIALICILAGVFHVLSRDKRTLVPVAAFLVWGIFALGHNMHERYLFPAVLLLVWAFLLFRDRRMLYGAAIASAVTLLNAGLILLYPAGNISQGIVAAISGLNLAGFVYCAVAVIGLCFTCRRGEPTESSLTEEPTAEERAAAGEAEAIAKARNTIAWGIPNVEARRHGRMRKWDYLIVLAIALVYGCLSLYNLGSTNVPESYWREREADVSYVVDLGEERDLGYLYYYPGIGGGTMEIAFSLDGISYDNALSIVTKEGDMYTWQRVDAPYRARYLRFTVIRPEIFLNEMGIYDAAGNLLPVQAEGKIAKLFDEQDRIDENPGLLTEMYFDEIYHARTAYEHILGMKPYENSHPPLGKLFISLGILAFGMNPFGWRIVGALFGVAILPLFYVLAKRIFKRTSFAAFSTLLLALDGMLFVQSRIATIDTYGVFFILAMCYFMYVYWEMNFFVDKLSRTLIPLGLSGIMFGLGTASKWIGIYAGGGLAVAFFTTLYKRYREYRAAKLLLSSGEGAAPHLRILETFWPNTIKTLLFCCVFFILIPVAIYLASYLPYFLCAEAPYDLKGVIGVQEFMLSYHSGLTATHPYQSPWYQWPVVYRPIWFYSGTNVGEGMMSSIASFGNPLIWWGGLLFTIYSIITYHRRTRGEKRALSFLFICLGAAFLPWTLITRATFIYHYFASVPFIILLTGFGFRWLEKRFSQGWFKWVYLCICLGVFCLFYPVWSGMEIGAQWAMDHLQWFPSWWFFRL